MVVLAIVHTCRAEGSEHRSPVKQEFQLGLRGELVKQWGVT